MAFQVGDRVIDVLIGEGEVVKVNKNTSYPIIVNFPCHSEHSYRLDGRYEANDLKPALFHLQGFQWPVPGIEPERIKLPEVNELVWVWEFNAPKNAQLAFFLKYDPKDRAYPIAVQFNCYTAEINWFSHWAPYTPGETSPPTQEHKE